MIVCSICNGEGTLWRGGQGGDYEPCVCKQAPQNPKIQKLTEAEAEILRNQRMIFYALRNMNSENAIVQASMQSCMDNVEKFLKERDEHY